jgi:hypothetical protein
MSYDDGEEGNRDGCYDVNMAGLLYLHPGLLVVLGSGLAILDTARNSVRRTRTTIIARPSRTVNVDRDASMRAPVDRWLLFLLRLDGRTIRSMSSPATERHWACLRMQLLADW